jgi:hypothetical protein
MEDILFLALGVVFFVACVGLAGLCETLLRQQLGG